MFCFTYCHFPIRLSVSVARPLLQREAAGSKGGDSGKEEGGGTLRGRKGRQDDAHQSIRDGLRLGTGLQGVGGGHLTDTVEVAEYPQDGGMAQRRVETGGVELPQGAVVHTRHVGEPLVGGVTPSFHDETKFSGGHQKPCWRRSLCQFSFHKA